MGGLGIGVTYYEGYLGPSHSSGAQTSSKFSISNITLSTYPAIDDGFTGLSASVNIANHYTAKITNATIWVGSVAAGTCATLSGLEEVQPGAQAYCKTGVQVNCDDFPTPPYVVKVEAEFADGTSSTTTISITSGLTTVC